MVDVPFLPVRVVLSLENVELGCGPGTTFEYLTLIT